MAGETLRTVNQMLANWPDNTQGLISPLDGRDMIVSEAVGVGFLLLDNGPVTVPIPAQDVWVQINSLITPIQFAGNFWQLDGNQAFTESYTAQGITVPPGTERLTTFDVGMLVSKVGGGTNTYEFSLFADGVNTATTGYVDVFTADPEYVTITTSRLPDYSLAETFDARVRCLDGTADLTLDEFRFAVQSVPV